MKRALLFLGVLAALTGAGIVEASYIQEGNRQAVAALGSTVSEISMPGRSVMSLDGRTVVYLKRDVHEGVPNDLMNLVAQDLQTGQYLEIVAWGQKPAPVDMTTLPAEGAEEVPMEPRWGEIQRVSVDRTGTWVAFEVRRPSNVSLWDWPAANSLDRPNPANMRGLSVGSPDFSQIYLAKIRSDDGVLASGRTAVEKLSLISLSTSDRLNSGCLNGTATCHGRDGDNYAARISGNGQFIAFASNKDNALLRWNRTTDQIEELLNAPSAINSISISEDGGTIAYEVSDVDAGHSPNQGFHDAVYVWKQGMNAPQLITRAVGTPQYAANGDSGTPFVSADGRYVAFDSDASNLIQNASIQAGIRNVYVYNVDTQQTELVTASRLTTTQGIEALGPSDGNSEAASISADGRYIAFRSKAKYIVPCYPNAAAANSDNDDFANARVYLWERTTGRITVLSDQYNTGSISANGLYTTLGNILSGSGIERLEGVGKLWDGQDRSFGTGNGATITCNAQTVPTVSWCGDQPAATFTWGQYNAITVTAGSRWNTSTRGPSTSPFILEASQAAVLSGTSQGVVVWNNQSESNAQRYVPFQLSASLNISTHEATGQVGTLAIPDTYQVKLSVDESCHAVAERSLTVTVPAAAGAAGKPSLGVSIDASASGIDMNSLTTQFPLAWNGEDADAVLVLRKLPNNQLKVLGLYDGMQMGKSTQGQDVRYVNVPVTDLLGTTTPPRGGAATRPSLSDIRIALVRYQAGTSPMSD